MTASKFHCGFAPGMAPVPKGADPPPLEQVERERAAYRRLLPALMEQQEGVSVFGGVHVGEGSRLCGPFVLLRCAVHASRPWTKPAHTLPACPCALRQCAAGAPPSVIARAAASSAALLDALLACGASVSGQQQLSSGAAAGAAEQGATREVPGWSALENGRGSLPLLHAAWFGWEAVQRLLERGADVNERSAEGGC